jgi:hypothetical protein
MQSRRADSTGRDWCHWLASALKSEEQGVTQQSMLLMVNVRPRAGASHRVPWPRLRGHAIT